MGRCLATVSPSYQTSMKTGKSPTLFEGSRRLLEGALVVGGKDLNMNEVEAIFIDNPENET